MITAGNRNARFSQWNYTGYINHNLWLVSILGVAGQEKVESMCLVLHSLFVCFDFHCCCCVSFSERVEKGQEVGGGEAMGALTGSDRS